MGSAASQNSSKESFGLLIGVWFFLRNLIRLQHITLGIGEVGAYDAVEEGGFER